MRGYLELDKLTENFERCRRYTKHYAKTFYFASHVLPGRKRRAAYAVYAFCRYVDDIADSGQLSVSQARQMLDDVREQLRRVYAGSPRMDERLLAFRHTVLEYRIPQEHFLDLLRGVEMDLENRRFQTFAALKDYCYCVACTVGLVMTHIFGVSDRSAYRRAEDLGIAMQLTNILRDVGEDYRRSRIYLPEDEMAYFGYSEKDLARGTINDEFIALMRYQIARARNYYRSADYGIPFLTADGSQFCVRLMRRLYAAILDQIERNGYNVFTRRACVPSWKKVLLAGATAVTRAQQPPQPEAMDERLCADPILNPKGHSV